MFTQDTKKFLDYMVKNNAYPEVQIIDAPPTIPKINLDGRETLNFCSNNYLSLAFDARLKEAAIEAIKKYGVGSGGSRLVSGTTQVQKELEIQIADFKGTESAITFSTGYMANSGAIPALMNPPQTSLGGYLVNKFFSKNKAVVFSDEYNHASIIDGIRLGKAHRAVFKHKNIESLEHQLKKYKRYNRKLIITDGVFSMDGDIAPLDKIMELSEKYGASVMVDDAHATGILGETGKGTAEHFKLKTNPEIMMGTFTKVFGGVGGYIAGSLDLTDYLRVSARTYIFSAPIPPAIASAMVKAVQIVKTEPERRTRLLGNATYLREQLNKEGFNTLNSETQIIPVLIGDEKIAIKVSKKLLEKGILSPCIRWPAVPHGAARLRVTVMADHTKDQIDQFINILKGVRNEFNF